MNLAIPYHLENFIGGHFIGPLSGEFIDNVNPSTGEIVGQIPNSNKKDIDVAVAAAKKAFPAWSTTATEKRFIILNKIAELIDENLEAFFRYEGREYRECFVDLHTASRTECVRHINQRLTLFNYQRLIDG